MTACTIHPIPLQMVVHDKSVLTYRHNFGQPFLGTMNAWYIEGAKENILVDAGVHIEYLKNVRKIPSWKIQSLDEGLNKLGLDFGDIDLVIFTQLHHDHTAYASRFPKARLLVQRDELEFARNPHPTFATEYAQQFLDGLKFEVISGDARICDEVSVISTPGHTPGGQSVSVKTVRGTAVIAGLCTCRENFAPPPESPLPVITPGIHTNALEAYDSCLRIKEMADIVVPIHDPEFLEGRTIPWPA